jgi:transposase
MAHARRYFEQALDNDKERAEYALTQMQKLYAVERTCREENCSNIQREELRKEKSVPVLAEMKQWLATNHLHVLPKSLIGKAIHYSLERWDKLSLYATNGRLEIDNNLVENQIRPVAIGRKNYLFAGSHDAARRHAMIYSFIGTCKLRGIDPESWLTDVLTRIQDHKVNKLHEFFA